LDLAEKLVNNGIAFRTAHQVIGKLVQSAHNLQKPLAELSESEIKKAVKGINAKEFLKILKSTTVDSSLRDRKSQGSSGIKEQKRMILQRKKKAENYKKTVNRLDKEVKTAIANLSQKIKTITK